MNEKIKEDRRRMIFLYDGRVLDTHQVLASMGFLEAQELPRGSLRGSGRLGEILPAVSQLSFLSCHCAFLVRLFTLLG